MKFKRTCLAFCLAFIMSVYAACSSSETNTAELTSSTASTLNTISTELIDNTLSITISGTVAETTEETMSEQEETTASETAKAESANTSVVPPDSDFWLKMFEIWCSDELLENGKELGYILNASPAGSSKVFYADIDGDGIKELCYIIDTFHGSGMYVCDYVDNNWKIVDALPLGYYTYFQPNDDGTTSLFVVVATRSVEPLDWYIYNNGVEEEFEFLDKDKLYEELLKIKGMDEQEEFFNTEIKKAMEKYDNLTNIYDTPYVMTMLLYETRPLTNESLRTENFDEEDVKRQLEEFTAEVAELFAE
ncbi:MAG: hypothetical protein K2N71_09040 [Oscillospiraceae bacterium]|nr:hypothetical protein [Oscillospiraceae bacterium]